MIDNFQFTDCNDRFSLKNRVAILTGAAGYLGKELAFCLGQAGAHIVLIGRTHQKLSQLRDLLFRQGIKSTILAVDITNHGELVSKIDQLKDTFDCIDILVNNAHSGRASHFVNAEDADFIRDYEINVIAAFNLMRILQPLMRESFLRNQDASIINISSMYGTISPDPRIYGQSNMNNPPYYGAAKAGLIQLTKYMACHLASDGIRVNSISPGPFPPETLSTQKPEFFRNLIDKVPLGRIGLPFELQGPVLFLASKASSYVTGVNLPVDGGWTAW